MSQLEPPQVHRSRAVAFFTTLLVACSGDGAQTCADAACRRAEIVQIWPTDHALALQKVTAISDPLEQEGAVQALLESDPAAIQELCIALPQGRAKERCDRVSTRPHLAMAVGDAAPPVPDAPARRAAGPGASHLRIPPAIRSPYADLTPTQDPCAREADPETCSQALLTFDIARADPDAIAQLCASMSETRWRSECFFDGAERLIDQSGVQVYAGAVSLCLASAYAQNCMRHVHEHLAGLAPDASAAPAAWTPSVQSAKAIADWWAPRDAAYADYQVSRFWGRTLALSYAGASEVTGDPIPALPAEALPHLRAAAAMRLLQLQGSETRTLQEWGALLSVRLKARAAQAATPASDRSLWPVTNLWTVDRQGDGDIPAVTYLAQSRRGLATDPEADNRICVLEAAARLQLPSLATLLEQGLMDADPTVKWTAARLYGLLTGTG